MIQLSQLLALLEKAGVDQVILQEGSAPHVRNASGLRAVARATMSRPDLARLLHDAGVGLEQPPSAAVQRCAFLSEGRRFEVEVLISRDRLQLRFTGARRTDAVAAATEAAPGRPGPPPGSAAPLQPPPAPRGASGDGAKDASLQAVLEEARRIGASDLHLSAGYPAQARRMGSLTPMGPTLCAAEVEKMLASILPPARRDALREVGYTDLAIAMDRAGRLRVNVSRQREGLKGCFRLIDEAPSSLKQLGLPEELDRITLHHQGLVVVSGPNGAGKTTTMSALIDRFNETKPVHIITVEDPVEIIHAPKKAVITQREVGTHTRTFQSALKGALREDPDVIAIGELRDVETVEMALSAAETGHLVIATMSTPSGAVTIDRLIDMFPRGVQPQVRSTLAGTLKMVVSQRLVPSRDGQQRHVAAELITGSIPLYAMIRDNKLFQLPSLLQQGRAFGMFRIEESLSALVHRGLVDLDAARRQANDPNAVTEAPMGAEAPPPSAHPRPATGLGARMAQKWRGR